MGVLAIKALMKQHTITSSKKDAKGKNKDI